VCYVCCSFALFLGISSCVEVPFDILPYLMIDYTGTMSLGVVRIWVAITRPSGSSKGVKGSKLSKA